MNAIKKLFVVVAVICFSSVSFATDDQHGRFTVHTTDDGNRVIYREGAYPPHRSPDDVGEWRHQIVIDYRQKRLWYYVCDFLEGEPLGCVPKLGDAVVTPDSAALPKDVVIGMVSRIYLGGRERPCFRDYGKTFGLDLPTTCAFFEPQKKPTDIGRFRIIWPVELTATKVLWANVLIRQDAMAILLNLIGQEALQDTAKDGVQVFLIRGDGKGQQQALRD